MVICRDEEEEKRGGNKITRRGVGGTVEDMVRASRGKPSLQGKTSLGFNVPVQGSDSNCLGT